MHLLSLSVLKVSLLFNGDDERDATCFEHNLVVHEESPETEEGVGSSDNPINGEGGQSTKGPSPRWQRSGLRISRSIDLEDLILGRSTRQRDDVHRMLVVGSLGTGKTSLGRKIAHRWASGEWGEEISVLYFIEAVSIQKLELETNRPQRLTFEAAIIDACFQGKDTDHEHESLSCQIRDDLASSSTLVVVDGLDECVGHERKVVDEAVSCNAKILFLSRPLCFDLKSGAVDRMVECRGFSDAQLERFVAKCCSKEENRKLMIHLKTDAQLWRFAHTPLVADILCTMWKKLNEDERDLGWSNRHKIYEGVVRRIWERFVNKTNNRRIDRDAFFDELGKIAFEASKGSVVIDSDLFRDRISQLETVDVCKQSGFLVFDAGENCYRFSHRMLQAFFGGRYLARCLNRQPEKDSVAATFVGDNKYDPKHEDTISFFLHETCSAGSPRAFDRALECLDCGARDILGIQHFLLHVRLSEMFFSAADSDASRKAPSAIDAIVKTAGCLLQTWRESEPAKALLFPLLRALCESQKTLKHRQNLFEKIKTAFTECEAWGKFDEAAQSLLHKTAVLTPELLKALVKTDDDMRSRLFDDEVLFALGESNDPQHKLEIAKKGCLHADADLRREAVGALGRLVEASPELAPEVMKIAKSFCSSQDWSVRKTGIAALASTVSARPDGTLEAFQLARKLCRGEDEDVRGAALGAFPAMLDAMPELAEQMFSTASERFSDRHWGTRRAALNVIGRAAETVPELARGALNLIADRCVDDDPGVRRTMVDGLIRVIKANPSLNQDALSLVRDWCGDQRQSARQAAMEVLGSVVVPDADREVALQHVCSGCSDSSVQVRCAATVALGRQAQAVPSIVAEELERTMRKCSDLEVAADERCAAFDAIEGALGAMPEKAKRALDLSVNSLSDQQWKVRRAAVSALGKIAKMMPEMAREALRAAAERCADEDSRVRRAAFSALGSIVEAMPEISKTTLTPESGTCRGRSEDLFLRIDNWEAMSSRDLIKLGLHFPVESVAIRICFLLAEVRVNVASCQGHVVILTFHSTTAFQLKVKKKDTGPLLRTIQKTVKREFPNLLSLARFDEI